MVAKSVGWPIAITALVFILLEVGTGTILRQHDAPAIKDPAIAWTYDYRESADSYSGASWVKDYYKELWQTKVRWTPYSYWEYTAFSGRYLNIDDHGHRTTWNQGPGSPQTTKPIRVFMFGGSTLFGTGARDAYTIPSVVARLLSSQGVPVEVSNFGQSGYVSTQEVISLMREIQKGNVPDIVAFYDGVNDVYSAYQNREAGIPQNEFNRIKEFNRDANIHSTFNALLKQIIQKSNIYRLMAKAGRPNKPGLHEDEVERLARDVGRVYFVNVAMVEELGKRFGFKTFFFWQPTIFTKGTLSEYEKLELKKEGNVASLYHAAYSQVAREIAVHRSGGVVDLSSAFEDTSSQGAAYIDFCHLSERGNQIVASQIVKHIQKSGSLFPK